MRKRAAKLKAKAKAKAKAMPPLHDDMPLSALAGLAQPPVAPPLDDALPPPPVVPPPPAPSANAPKEGNGWRVGRVPGGWLRFSQQASRLDAHCDEVSHGGNCKMDRSLKKCPLGLCLAWLACHSCLDKADHNEFKKAVANPDYFDERSRCRAEFPTIPGLPAELIHDILAAELAAHGSNDEPLQSK